MQANTANEHSQMLAQVPANACSDSESRKCRLVLLLVSYSTLGSEIEDKQNKSRCGPTCVICINLGCFLY